MSLDLPYSVIRGEAVLIPIVVFNYLNKDVTAEVTLTNDGEFEFADITNEVNDELKPGKTKIALGAFFNVKFQASNYSEKRLSR